MTAPDLRGHVLRESRDRFLSHAGTGDLQGAIAVAMDAHADGMDANTLIHGLLIPAQVEVGERWARNEWGVAQERVATQAATAALILLNRESHNHSAHGHLLVTCVEGERHELPARMLAADLRRAGWNVSFLGDAVPAAEVRRFAAHRQLDAVLLSATGPESL